MAATVKVQGVSDMDDREAAFQRRAVVVLTVLPFMGFVFAVVTLWGSGLSIVDAAIGFAMYVFTGLGVTVGYHRLFTHGSFQPTRPLKVVLAVAGTMAVQGSIISWVSAHRRHHAYSDREGDPHSPHLDEGPGITGVLRGLWHAHIGWLAAPEKTEAERWAPDLLKDPDLVLINRLAPHLIVASFAIPPVVGWALTGSAQGAVTAFLWASLARIFFLHHVTWSINSICHFYGKRPFASSDLSTNNWVLALVSFGESWHNNHHAFPTSAIHGLGRGQIDISAWVIRFFEKVRLAHRVKLVTTKQLASKAVTEFKARSSAVLEPAATSSPD